MPNRFGGRENLEAIDVPAAAEHAHARRASRHDHGGGGIDGVARRQPPGAPRRPRLHLQVEHGLDARHARVRAARIRSTAAGPQPGHVLDALRVHRELHPAVLARRGRARQARDARQDAGRRVAEVRRRCARSTATCTRTRARSCCSWATSSGSGASGTTTAASTGICWTIRCTAASRARRGSESRSTPASRRCTRCDFDPAGLPVDRLQRQREQRRLVRAIRAPRPTLSS